MFSEVTSEAVSSPVAEEDSSVQEEEDPELELEDEEEDEELELELELEEESEPFPRAATVATPAKNLSLFLSFISLSSTFLSSFLSFASFVL